MAGLRVNNAGPRAGLPLPMLARLISLRSRISLLGCHISVATLKREWVFAKEFIYRQLTGAESEGEQADDQTLLSTSRL
jgi:hypothetical protein